VAAAEARVFTCARCGVAVRICRPCDRGNIYCPPCRPVARRERVKRAGAQYQQREAGRLNHKRRQQEYLVRGEVQGKMTHRGSPASRAAGHSPARPADEPREQTGQRPHSPASALDRLRCDFCGREVRETPTPMVSHGQRRIRRGPRLPIGRVRGRPRGRGS
jgi:hypothetical protein